MSDDDTLFYNGRRLFVKADGYEFSIPTMPTIDALPKNTTEIDVYLPHSRFLIREGKKKPREMEPPEREAVLRLFRRFAQFGCGLFRRQP